MLIRDEVRDRPTGHFILDIYRNGSLIERMDEPNLVVTKSKKIQAQAISGVAAYAVTQMGYGSNGANPQLTDTALTNPFYKAFDSIAYPADNQIQFNFSLGVNDANGYTIQEFGLVSGNTNLFARKVRLAPLVKQNDITVSGSWIITF
ncbi:hypothetical protein [Burkholderia sp. Ac-20349]|uniref:hypothetical protein n=1 Tax=Burkholderia sp. Ac-20349 TaxID=2703893 RepID=UPI00197C6CEB|nr:hypothetical protein [Burkholderia sp. Ac-20349]MBN3839264.1 hypothetical protein [Burkholderia sp. Ac-20349]